MSGSEGVNETKWRAMSALFYFWEVLISFGHMKSKRIGGRRGRVRGPDGLASVRLLVAIGQVKIPARSPRAARTLDRMGD